MSVISSKSEGAKKRDKGSKKLKRIYSVNTILWRWFTFFACGVILVIAIACYTVLGSSMLTQSKKRIRTIGDELVAVVNDPNVPNREVEKKVADYALIEGVDIFFFDGEGVSQLSNINFQPEVLASVYEEMIEKVGGWEEGKVSEFNTRESSKTSYNFVACVRFKGKECRILVKYPVTSISGSVRRMELYVLIIALAALLIAFFISYGLAKKLSEPIRNISGTARKLAAGDYSVQFNSAEYSEIAKLSDTLNYMKEEIKKSDEFQKNMLANVSHDLKTPLTMIKAYASMIKEISGDDPEKRDKHLQVIIDESDRLTGLVNDILNTSKINAGIEQLNKKISNLTEVLYGVINNFSYLQETQGYNIMVDVDANLYTSADEEKIKQVFYNLLSNAINYTGEDKTVYVKLKYSPENSRIHFSVRDTGKGIGEEELDRIWDRYYRSSDSHIRPVKGTGLGLNIVKVILKAHSFDFGVKCDGGEGSTFYVDFPSA